MTAIINSHALRIPADRSIVPMTREEAALFERVSHLLIKFGLSIYCKKCYALGLPDGVEGANDPNGREANVSCGCTTRRYRSDAAPSLQADLSKVRA